VTGVCCWQQLLAGKDDIIIPKPELE
jgi:hypothetical protein